MGWQAVLVYFEVHGIQFLGILIAYFDFLADLLLRSTTLKQVVHLLVYLGFYYSAKWIKILPELVKSVFPMNMRFILLHNTPTRTF